MQEPIWQIDKDGDGKMGLQDVQQALARGGIPVPAEEDLAGHVWRCRHQHSGIP